MRLTTMSIIKFLRRQFDKFIRIPLAQHKFSKINILSSEASIKYIIENKCSVSRFGDGEFDIMLGRNGNTFQEANPHLAAKLLQVLTSNEEINHVVGIPYPLKSRHNLRASSRDFWGYYTLTNCNKLLPLLSSHNTYVDTQLSRFYIIYKDKSHCVRQLHLLKQIWENRDIVIVEGIKSRTGVGNDLYDNAKSIQRILGPATNAFDKYDEMFNAIIKFVPKTKLVILCYGMCATVLAYDLAKLGYQAVDLGHLDIEYEWMKMGATENVPVKGKFTNEAGERGRNDIDDIIDRVFEQQVVYTI